MIDTQNLPDNIDEVGENEYAALCCVCGSWTPLTEPLATLPPDYKHYCGKTAWCFEGFENGEPD